MQKKLFADPKTNLRRLILLLMAAAFVAFLIFLNRVQKPELVTTVGRTFERARVVEIVKDNIQEDGRRYGEQNVRVLMLSGPKKGQTVDATSSAGYLFGAGCTPGMKVIVIQSVSGDITVTSVYNADRELVVYIFVGLFFLLLSLIGGWQGVKACIGLIFTFVCIIFLYIPLIFRGFSPFWAAVLVAAVTTFVTMYLIGGPTKKTACAIIGTVAGVIIAGVAATGFGYFSGISGYNVSDIENLLFLEETTRIQIGGLLFSGLLIASLGAVIDVAMSVSSTIDEIHEKKPDSSRLELFKSGMRVGRDMMGTTSATLILAFAGSSVSVMVTNYVYDLPYIQIINSYNIGIEIMQGISGSIGVILTVPIVAAVAAFSMGNPVQEETASVSGQAMPAESSGERPALHGYEKSVLSAADGSIAAFITLLHSFGRKLRSFFRRHGKAVFILLCVSVLIFCGFRLYFLFSAYVKGGREYGSVEQSMRSTPPDNIPSTSPSQLAAGIEAEDSEAPDEFRFDYGKLTVQNSDAVGWVRLPGTRLSYPVVQDKDNEYYLNHTFYKHKSIVGAIFLDSRIKNGFGAQNSIVYGHNMRDGSMFTTLVGFRETSFYLEHPTLELYTESGKKECAVFSVYKTSPDSDIYDYDFANEKEYGKYLEKITKLSLYDTGVKPTSKDHILTLSTCVGDGQDMRFVVHAKVLE